MRESGAPPTLAAPTFSTSGATHHHVSLEHGDTYVGSVEVKHGVALPHGHGVWLSGDGRTEYDGEFVQRWRDGYGRLRTPTFTLWARWRMDRPDVSSSVRVDYPNGGRYCGFVELKSKAPPLEPGLTRSKFSTWAATVALTRHNWGEHVTAGGDRYVGEWVNDEREGFGCCVWASSSRYVGRFHRNRFHGTGALFIAPAEVEGCLSRLCSEGWRCEGDGGGESAAARPKGSTLPRWPPASRGGWDGVVVDGVWLHGKCHGEAHVTLPQGIRISAEWRTASCPVDGELVLPLLSPQARMDPELYEWRESFQWESLLRNDDDEQRRREAHEAASEIRARIQLSSSTELVRNGILELLNTHEVTKKTLRIFRRCFYCLYGTCGADVEVGGGGGGNHLGWCALRHAYGGCVHPLRGRRVGPGDLDLALRDIVSLARSMVRWVLDMMGPEQQSKVVDCGGEAVVGRWVADAVFTECYPVLLNLYCQVYSEQETALAASLARLRDTCMTLDDIGVHFARQSESQAKLFDPYTDAVRCVEQLNMKTQSLTKLLKVLVQWSREIDLSTRITYACTDVHPALPRDVAASADDLLPIHQYVLSRSRCLHLYAVTRMLVDFAAEPLFIEATSQEAFGVTTLQVCVLTLLRLHPWERDSTGILVPFSMMVDLVGEAVRRRAVLVKWVWQACCTSPTASWRTSGAAQNESVVRRYVALWVPRVLGWMGEHATAIGPQSVDAVGFTSEELACINLRVFDEDLVENENEREEAEALRFCCWLYACVIFDALQVRLLYGSFPMPHHLHSLDDVKAACAELREGMRGSGCASACLHFHRTTPTLSLIPSHFLKMETALARLVEEA